ncbi:hypothetical protein MNEG_2808, partial [Monoraphidium neglectum]
DGGSITAGNSSPLSDGACALVVASAERAPAPRRAARACGGARLRGRKPASSPEWFTTAPAAATRK